MAVSAVFFTYAYPPARYPRSIQISRLAKFSRHAIRVVCCDDGSPADHTIANALPGRPAELHAVRRRPLHALDPRRLSDKLPAPDGYRRWVRDAAGEMLARGWIGGSEVLVTFGDPMSDHLAGLQVRRAMAVPWIAHFSDPWVDNPYHRKSPLTNWLNRKLERDVISAADRVVFTSRETADLVMTKYPTAWKAKARVIPHAFDPGLYGGRPGRDAGIIVRHVGNFYPPRSPRALIAALAMLHRDRPAVLAGVRVELVGQIRPALDADAIAAALPPGLLAVRASVDYLESLRLMQEADLLLVVDAPTEHSVFLPSKLIDYLGAKRPILAISPPGACADLVLKLGGAAARPDDPAAIAEKLAGSIAGLRQPSSAWGDAGLRERYAAPRVAAEFDGVIDEIART